MDYLQMGLIILVLLVGLGAGILVNVFWNRYRRNGKPSLPHIKRAGDDLPTGHYRDLWNNTSMGLLLVDEKGDILTINPYLIQLSGVIIESDHPKNVSDLFNSSALADLYHSLLLPQLREIKDKGVFMDLHVLCESSTKDFGVFASWVEADPTGRKNILLAFLDIPTQLKSSYGSMEVKQQAEEARRLKTNFLSNMSHEIRTPLNGILGSTANLILQNNDKKELVEQLEIIMLSGERLLNTINNILDMSRLVANKMDVKLEKTNLSDFISLILIPYKSLAIKKGLLLTLKQETKPLTAKIDKKYFELIVTNIVENAIKYSDRGLIRITLRSDQRSLYLYVQDDGIGISENYLNRLFTPFEQESFGYDREFEGSGIGLTITKNLVDLLSGEIKIDSKKGEGTLVSVTLPLLGDDESYAHKN
jgi:nitrogen-specific signal transduction histidine kinase